MIEIEIELTSNEKNVTEVLQKLTELLRNAENQGFNVKELELEVDKCIGLGCGKKGDQHETKGGNQDATPMACLRSVLGSAFSG